MMMTVCCKFKTSCLNINIGIMLRLSKLIPPSDKPSPINFMATPNTKLFYNKITTTNIMQTIYYGNKTI